MKQMKIYDSPEEIFNKFKDSAVSIATAGNLWFRAGYPAIAEKLMEANLMMLKEIITPGDEDPVAQKGLYDLLDQIREEKRNNGQEDQTTH